MERSLDQNLSRVSQRSSSTEEPGTVEPEYVRQGDRATTYRPRSDATPEGELSALAAVYAFVLKCHEQKLAAGGGDGENTAEGDHVGESPEQFTAREGGS